MNTPNSNTRTTEPPRIKTKQSITQYVNSCEISDYSTVKRQLFVVFSDSSYMEQEPTSRSDVPPPLNGKRSRHEQLLYGGIPFNSFRRVALSVCLAEPTTIA